MVRLAVWFGFLWFVLFAGLFTFGAALAALALWRRFGPWPFVAWWQRRALRPPYAAGACA